MDKEAFSYFHNLQFLNSQLIMIYNEKTHSLFQRFYAIFISETFLVDRVLDITGYVGITAY